MVVLVRSRRAEVREKGPYSLRLQNFCLKASGEGGRRLTVTRETISPANASAAGAAALREPQRVRPHANLLDAASVQA